AQSVACAPRVRSVALVLFPPERIELFSQHQQGRRLGQSLLLVAQLTLERLDFGLVCLALLPQRVTLLLTALKSLQALLLPTLDLFRIEPLLTTVLAQLGL